MVFKKINIQLVEYLAFTLIWAGVFGTPFFIHKHFGDVQWNRMIDDWINISFFFIVFILNSYWLVPKYLFNRKYIIYTSSIVLMISILIGGNLMIEQFKRSQEPVYMPPMELGPGMPPMELGSRMAPPLGYKAPPPPVEKPFFMVLIENLIISLLVIGASTAFKMMSQWINEEDKRKDIEKEQLKTELALLRHQVSPHFFMNTLNNIHALVDIDTETAKDAIIRLSTLMRYLLYDTAKGNTSLPKEIEFIRSYISLMQLRFSKKVKIDIELPAHIPDIQIPPMMYISFLENAFKHGVSYQAESYVIFKLEIIEKRLNCQIKNSNPQSKKEVKSEYSGIGLANIKKSLEILFKNDYILEIEDNASYFEVYLSIPINM
jgi:hypothetical protein